MFGLFFGISGNQKRKAAVIKTSNYRICVGLVATAFHLLLRKERRCWSQDRQTSPASEIQLCTRLSFGILGATLRHGVFVLVKELYTCGPLVDFFSRLLLGRGSGWRSWSRLWRSAATR